MELCTADEDDYAVIHYHCSGCGDNYSGSSWRRNTKCGRMRRRLHHGHPAKCSSMAGKTLDKPSFRFNFPAKLTNSLQHPLIDANNKSGSLEFSVGGNPDDFFPVTLAFNSTKSFSGIKVRVVIISIFSTETIFSGSRLRGG